MVGSGTEAIIEIGAKVVKAYKDYDEGKLDQEEFERIQKENFKSIMEQSFIKSMVDMDNETAILFGNLMNKKREREGKPLLFSGPEVPVPPELLDAVCQNSNEYQEEEVDEDDEPPPIMFNFSNTGFSLMFRVGPVIVTPTVQSIWGRFGETDSSSEGEY